MRYLVEQGLPWCRRRRLLLSSGVRGSLTRWDPSKVVPKRSDSLEVFLLGRRRTSCFLLTDPGWQSHKLNR